VSYASSELQPGETIKAVGRLHWIVFVRSFALLTAGAALLLYGYDTQRAARGDLASVLVLAGGLVLLVGLALWLSAWFHRWITEISVTTHRVIYKTGFVRRHTVEMNMDKVETVDVDQSPMGRLLGFGTICVRGTGQSIESLRRVSHPIQLRNAITAG
jgi:membrane protein YdbS with pleckstrin-like domain